MKKTFTFFIINYSILVINGFTQVPFSTSPSWTSAANNEYSTGAAWCDINKDGWLDLVIANGNDMSRQRLAVYYNTNGTLPTSPNWQSADIDYHGHLSVGDINKDGFPDVAVSVYIGAGGFSTKGRVKVYLNSNGTLSSNPSWLSGDSMYTFSCAFGDADNDGDLDLAVACGESYEQRSERNRIYYNNNGTLNTMPGWTSNEIGYSYDVTWADFNNDGRLDLIFANERGPNKMYLNYGDSIGRSAYWTSTDASQYANSIFAADVNNDSYIEVAVSDNNQLGGTGKFKIYMNNSGTLATTPIWSSAWSGYGSGINLADIDFDNDVDLIGGGWWSACRIYQNTGGTFNTNPQWTSSTNSVVEAIVFGDMDNDALDTVNTQFTGNGTRKLFYLARKPVQKIVRIYIGNDTATYNQYSCDLENGWICFASAPPNAANILIKTICSHDLDFAISNWDPNIGNYVFKNTTVVDIPVISSEVPVDFVLYQNYPNPFNPVTKIRFSIPVVVNSRGRSIPIHLKIYDILGQEITTLVNEPLKPGTYEVDWNASNYAGSVYFYSLILGDPSTSLRVIETKSMVLIK
jgi:hypothetical protein